MLSTKSRPLARFLWFSIVLFVLVTIVLYHFENKALFTTNIISQYLPIQIIHKTNDTIPSITRQDLDAPQSSAASHQLPSQTKSTKNKYSSFVCIGGDTHYKINNYKKQFDLNIQHTCHFKNICYSNKMDKWLYYARPPPSDTLLPIIQTEQDTIHYDFNITRSGFIMQHAMHKIGFEPTIIHDSFPTQNMYKLFDKTVIYHYLQWVYNFGHVLTDNFYSMYRALHYFHLYTNNTCCQPLFNYWWGSAGFSDHVPAFLPIKFINNLNQYLFNGSKPIFLGFDSRAQHHRDPEIEAEYERLFAYNDTINDLACFKNIVIGTDDFRVWWKAIMRKFHHRWDFTQFINLFRKHPLHVARYNHYMNTVKQKILFISKGEGERRKWTNDTNVSAIVGYLEGLFGVGIDCVDGSELYNGKSLTQQIDFILPYSLVITACGAVSYIGAFMRSGTAMITVDYWHLKHETTSHIDSYIWEYLSDRKTYYYFVTRDEWEMPSDFVLPKRYNRRKDTLLMEDVRNDASYRLKAPRLSKYVYSALLWIEHYNGWSDTFTRPPIFPIAAID